MQPAPLFIIPLPFEPVRAASETALRGEKHAGALQKGFSRPYWHRLPSLDPLFFLSFIWITITPPVYDFCEECFRQRSPKFMTALQLLRYRNLSNSVVVCVPFRANQTFISVFLRVFCELCEPGG